MQARREERMSIKNRIGYTACSSPQSADAALTFAREQAAIKNLSSGLLVPAQPVETQRVIRGGSQWLFGDQRVIDFALWGALWPSPQANASC